MMEATAEWKLNRHVTVNAAYVHLFGGSYVREVGGKDVNYFSTTVSFLF